VTERMNPEVKAKWLTALRSGEYEQTTGQLHRIVSHGESPAGWCCYGVLCDVAIAAGVKVIRKTDEAVEYFDGSRALLPEAVVEWAGLSANDPEVHGRSLAHRNDNGVPFGEIAALIEEHL
jgi:hypothetical protein